MSKRAEKEKKNRLVASQQRDIHTDRGEREREGGGKESLAVYYSLLSASLVSVALATQQQAAWSGSLRDSVRNALLLFYYY